MTITSSPKNKKGKRPPLPDKKPFRRPILPTANRQPSPRSCRTERPRYVSNRQAVATALYALGPAYHDDDELWLKVGQALFSWDGTENTRNLWAAWSSKSESRKASVCAKHWKAFGNSGGTKSITIDDLFGWAADCGWEPPEKTSRKGDGPHLGAWELAEQILEASFLRTEGNTAVLTLRFHRGEFFRWESGRYVPKTIEDVRTQVVCFLGERGLNVTSQSVAAVVDCIRARTIVPPEREMPDWLEGPNDVIDGDTECPAPPEDLIAARNGLIDVNAFLEGRPCVHPLTARFFSNRAVDFDFRVTGKNATRWETFLKQIFPDDKSSIDALQEWFGYVVMGRTNLQKALMVHGPSRSGKGTIAKVQTALVGHESVVALKLADFKQNFGLSPLIGKTLCIIPDARLDNSRDDATLVERILSISGEDRLTLDRKHKEHVTVQLRTRLMIFTNELPSWADTAGGLASRLIILKLTRRFPSPDGADSDDEIGHDNVAGVADPKLFCKLERELPAILRWALRGWKRLQHRGHFVQPLSARPLLRQMANLASPVGAFIRDECTLAKSEKILTRELFRRWKLYCMQTGHEAGDIQHFARDLFAVAPQVSSDRKKKKGKTDYWFCGIAFSGSGG